MAGALPQGCPRGLPRAGLGARVGLGARPRGGARGRGAPGAAGRGGAGGGAWARVLAAAGLAAAAGLGARPALAAPLRPPPAEAAAVGAAEGRAARRARGRLPPEGRGMASLKNTPRARKLATLAQAGGRRQALAWAAYQLDRCLELYPGAYFVMLAAVVGAWVLAGAAAWWLICYFGLKRGTIMGIGIRGAGLSFPDAMWAAWAAMVSASNHTKEIHAPGRLVAAVVAAGGLLSYSVLTGSISASVKTRIDTRRAAHSSRVVEEGHVVVAGANAHLGPLLEQLSDARLLAERQPDGWRRRWGGAQTVLLLNSGGGSAAVAEGEARAKALAREGRLPRLRVVSRRGDLGAPGSFAQAGAASASKVVLLADDEDGYEADARQVAGLLALQATVEAERGGDRGGPEVVVEASRRSSAELVERLGSEAGLRVAAVEDLTSKLLVQCARQPGLAKVYRKLMTHTGPVINVRAFPDLAGLPYAEARRSFSDAVVCGLVRDGRGASAGLASGGRTEVLFQPPAGTRLGEGDQLMLIALKGSYRRPPPELQERAAECRGVGASTSASAAAPPPAPPPSAFFTRKKENVLLLGWRDTCPEMLNELGTHLAPGSQVVVLAQAPAAERESLTASKRRRRALAGIGDLGAVRHLEGNPLSRTDVTRALEATAATPGAAYSVIVLADSDWRAGALGGARRARADARVSFASALVRELVGQLPGLPQPVSVVSEVTDRAVGRRIQLSGGGGAGVPPFGYISSSEIMALFTSQVVEHSYLSAVWAELLSSYGHEIQLRPCRGYLEGRPEAAEVTFRDLERLAEAKGEVALGFATEKKGKGGKGPKMRTVVNPVPKDRPLGLRWGSDYVIVIARRT